MSGTHYDSDTAWTAPLLEAAYGVHPRRLRFPETGRRITAGLQGLIVYIDDIIIFGDDQEAH